MLMSNDELCGPAGLKRGIAHRGTRSSCPAAIRPDARLGNFQWPGFRRQRQTNVRTLYSWQPLPGQVDTSPRRVAMHDMEMHHARLELLAGFSVAAAV